MNYQEIIEQIKPESVIKLMEALGADRYDERENMIIFPTICHNIDSSEASMKLYFYKDTKLFVCYTSCSTMSIFKFLKTYYETRQIEYNWFDDIYQVVLNCGDYKPKEGFQIAYQSLKDRYRTQRAKKLEVYPKGVLDIFVKHYPVEWLNDGISKDAMDKFGIRFSISQNKIIIPHFDAYGDLVGIRGRALNEWEIENLGKYMPVKIEDKWYTHPLSLNLYGLNETRQNIRESGICFLGEAEKFVLQMEGFKRKNCSAAVCGSQFNKFQLNILMRHCQPREICLCFDSEEIKGKEEYFNKLYGICKKYSNYCNMSFIYDREGLLELKDSPTDKGEEIFEKLVERRVIVK